MRIKELERLYGIEHGGNHGNQYVEARPNNSVLANQSDIASQMGISVDTLQNYKLLSDMIPELSDLVDPGLGGIVTGKQIGRASCRERVLRLV